MNLKQIDDAKGKAEKAIAGILRDLELATECYVIRVDVDNIDTTRFDSDTTHWERMVQIEIKSPPGSRWGQAGTVNE